MFYAMKSKDDEIVVSPMLAPLLEMAKESAPGYWHSIPSREAARLWEMGEI